MPQEVPDYKTELAAIRQWLAKETYLPQNFDDLMLKKFLHSCYGSLERTKKCIERFSVTRTTMTEVYIDRDPCSEKLKTAFSIAYVGAYRAENMEILIHQLDDPTLENFVYYDLIKTFSLQADYYLWDSTFFPDGHIIIMDIKDYTLKILPKVSVMFFRDYLLYLLEGMPVRVKSVHVINYPSYYEKLFALIKPVLPTNIVEVITFHPNYESLQKAIGRQYLPIEYGGDAESLKEQQRNWVKKIQERREVYLDDNMWKADLKKKPKSAETAMTGSFKTLSID